MNFFAIFLTGLTSGGVTCASVQGGLLASVIANQEKAEVTQKSSSKKKQSNIFSKKDFLPVISFLIAKLLSHSVLGFFLGWLGQTLSISLHLQIALQIFAALFILATAANFLEIHPIFRYLSFQSPSFVRKLLKSNKESNLLFAPAVLGLLSVFIPCGVTQSMEILAMSSGSALQGALTMFFFVLGTFPIFTFLGVFTMKLTQKWHSYFNKLAAILLIIIGLYTLNAALIAANAPINSQKIFSRFQKRDSENSQIINGQQKVTIQIENNGYTPRYFTVKKGVPVELTLESGQVYSCAQSFVMQSFGIHSVVASNQRKTFVFTPEKKGKYSYSCSMGMYTGIMEVI
jgi:sulfite exporter TauE/SafE